jgi:hypothetical protein
MDNNLIIPDGTTSSSNEMPHGTTVVPSLQTHAHDSINTKTQIYLLD